MKNLWDDKRFWYCLGGLLFIIVAVTPGTQVMLSIITGLLIGKGLSL